MKKILFSLFVITISFSTLALAAPILQLPEQINAILINGTEPTNIRYIELKSGHNQLVFRFEGELGQTFDEKERTASDVFVILFRTENDRLKLHIPKIRNDIQLKEFNQHPGIKIIAQSGEEIAYTLDKLEKEGFQMMRDYQQELRIFNRGNSPAAYHLNNNQRPSGQPGLAEVITIPEETGRTNQTGQEFSKQHPTQSKLSSVEPTMAEKMLQYWYKLADEKTRERFKQWITE